MNERNQQSRPSKAQPLDHPVRTLRDPDPDGVAMPWTTVSGGRPPTRACAGSALPLPPGMLPTGIFMPTG